MKANAAMYPLSAAAKPHPTKFVNFSGMQINTVHANDFTFYEELNEVVQHEPDDFLESEVVGILASIGIKKGKPFAPDARMKAILTDAAAVGQRHVARDDIRLARPADQGLPRPAVDHHLHAPEPRVRRWRRTERWMRAPCPSTTSPASRRRWPSPKLGQGAAYVYTARDAKGEWLDGSKNYKVTLPPNIPAGRFWSFNVYDNQHRSFLETDQKAAGLDSTLPGREEERRRLGRQCGSARRRPPGRKATGSRRGRAKASTSIFRLYGPLQGWFDKSWRPGDLER